MRPAKTTCSTLANLQLLILIALANSSPVLAKRIFVENFAAPVDVGFKFTDGRPLFGASKTVRGIVAWILVTAACAPLLGLQLQIGLLVALTAMAGGICFPDFSKRRLGLPSSSQAVGLDQIPEISPSTARMSSNALTNGLRHHHIYRTLLRRRGAALTCTV